MMDYAVVYRRSYPRGLMEIIHHVQPLLMHRYSAGHSTHLALIFLHRSYDRHHIARLWGRDMHRLPWLLRPPKHCPGRCCIAHNTPLYCIEIYWEFIVYPIKDKHDFMCMVLQCFSWLWTDLSYQFTDNFRVASQELGKCFSTCKIILVCE